MKVLKEIEGLLKLKKFDQASLAIEKLPPENRLDGMILKSKILEREGNINQALTLEKHALKESKKKEIPLLVQPSYSLRIYHELNKTTPDMPSIQADICAKYNPYSEIVDLQEQKEELNLALKYLENHVTTHKKHVIESGMVFYFIGCFHELRGELTVALDYHKRCLKLLETHPILYRDHLNQLLISYQLQTIGGIYASKGNSDLALDYYRSSLNISKEISDDHGIAYALIEMSYVYGLKGELNQALELIYQSMKIFSDLEQQDGILRCLLTSGMLYKQDGKPNLALKYLEEAWTHLKGKGGTTTYRILRSSCLFYLSLVAQDLGSPEQAEIQFQRYSVIFQKTHKQERDKLFNLRYHFVEAIALKMKTRGRWKLQAIQKFQEILDDEIIQYEITILSILNLWELLLLEMKISDEEEVTLQEIKSLNEKFSQITQNQNLPLFIMISFFILQAKLSLVEGDFEKASDLLTDAERVVAEEKLDTLLSQVQREQTKLQTELEKWKGMIRRNVSIVERMELARVMDYVKEAKKLQETWIRPSVELATQLSQFTKEAKKLTEAMRNQKFVLNLNEIKEATMLIKKGENWGSGFLAKTDPGTDFSHYWFVTAGHCVYNRSTTGYIYDKTVEWFLYTKEKDKEFIQIPTHSGAQEGKTAWRKHMGTDLAVRAIYNDDLELDLYFPTQKFCFVKKLENLRTGIKVDYFGYDDENIDSENPVPQLKHRRGDIDHIDPETKILSISGTAVGGFSGGPVFIREITESGVEGGIPRHTEKFYLIGIMIAVSQPQEKTRLPRNEIKVASVDLIDELIQR